MHDPRSRGRRHFASASARSMSLLELRVVLRAADEVALLRAVRDDEERGRAADAVRRSPAVLSASISARVGAAVEGRLPLVHVEVELLGVAVEVVALDLLLVGEHLVVHRPEGARALLLERLAARLRRERRVRVHRQRKVVPDELDLVAVVLHHLRDRRLDAPAERALEVAPLVDGDLRAHVAARRVVRRERRRDVLHLGRRAGPCRPWSARRRRRSASCPCEMRACAFVISSSMIFVELLLGLRADEAPAVDEEVRRAARLEVLATGRCRRRCPSCASGS